MIHTAVLLLAAVSATHGFSEMKEYLDMWNWESECWGEKNVATFHQLEEELVGRCLQTPVDGSLDTRSVPAMQTAASVVQPHVASYLRPAATYPFMQMPGLYGPYNGLYRGKRAATGQELLSAAELKEMWVMKVSNLTCFMRGIGAIDENFAIQKEFLRTKVWEMKDLTAAEHLADPVWRTKMSQFWVDCADTAEAIPAPVLDHCPLARMFGPLARTMRFMMCKKEVTQKMCAMAQAEKLQRKYHPGCLGGDGASVLQTRDRYEEALACAMTLMHGKMTADMTGQFVKKAIRGEM